MKQVKKSVFLLSLVVCFALIASISAQAKEVYKKTISKQATVNPDALLDIYNQFGDVEMTAYDGSEVILEITIGLEAKNQNKADELLRSVELDYRATAREVYAHINLSGKNYQNLDINWKVKFPMGNDLKLGVRYGDLKLNEANAKTEINVSYGKISLGNLRSKENTISLKYGEGSIESADYLSLTLRYSEMDFIGKVKLLNLNSMYSEASLVSIGRLKLSTGYDDIEIAAVAEFIVDGNYTDIEVGAVTMKLDANLGFGDLEVNKISKDFKQVDLVTSYTDSELTFEQGSSLILSAKSSYGEISVEGMEVSTTEGLTSEEVKGNAGSEPYSPVNITVSFGEAELSFD